MHDLAGKEIGHRGKTDMRMRPHVDPGARLEHRGAEMVEKDEGADHARLARRQGATHLVVLRSRLPLAVASGANGVPLPRPPRSVRLLCRTTLRGESPELRTALLTRGPRTAADVARIAELEADGRALTIRPPASAPPVSRLTTDGALLSDAVEAGHAAVHAAFSE